MSTIYNSTNSNQDQLAVNPIHFRLMETKPQPILSVTEYNALIDILRAVREIAYVEPELCQKPLSYDTGSILNGTSGLGFVEELKETLTSPDSNKLYEIVDVIEDKLSLWRPFTNEKQLEHLVSFDHMPDGWEKNNKATIQEQEGYVIGSHYESYNKVVGDYVYDAYSQTFFPASLLENNRKD